MAISCTPPMSSVSPVSSTATPMAFISSSSFPFRWPSTCIGLNRKFVCGWRICAPLSKTRGCIVARAADGDQGQAPEAEEETSGDKEKGIPIEDLPLESKLQQKLEQKLKMKLAKKIRLRRKRLVRKRHLRKKGRWPPSKMKKLKNV